MEALGRTIDFSIGFAPVDMAAAANTGKRVAMRNSQGLTVVLFKAVGAGGEPPVLTFNQHTASSGGSSQVIAGAVDHFWKKSLASMTGSEVWTLASFAAASSVTLTGEGALQGIYVFHLDGARLADGFRYVSVDVADVGATAQLGTLWYIQTDLEIQRKPSNLKAGLS